MDTQIEGPAKVGNKRVRRHEKEKKKAKRHRPDSDATTLDPTPTLSSSLFASLGDADAELDAIFKSSAGRLPNARTTHPVKPISNHRPIPVPAEEIVILAAENSLEGNDADEGDSAAPVKTKRPKSNKKVSFISQSMAGIPPKTTDNGPSIVPKPKLITSKRKPPAGPPDRKEEIGLEEGYAVKSTKRKAKSFSESHSARLVQEITSKDHDKTASEVGVEDSDGVDDPPPTHESLGGKPKTSKQRQVKYSPEGETSEQRDARTIFVGNLPVDVAKSKSALKALCRHLLSPLSPNNHAKIESTRLRSVAFKASTESAQDGPEGDKPSDPPSKPVRQQDRASAWRQALEEVDDPSKSGAQAPAKVFLNSKEKKKVSFIKGELNDKAQTVNCYVVFAHSPLHSALQSPPMTPADVARKVVEMMDGSTFMERTIRVDLATRSETAKGPTDGRDAMKRTLFVGNLAFEAKEEDVRWFFEALVAQERGEVVEGSDAEEESDENTESESDGENVKKIDNEVDLSLKPSKRWVQYVRIVRDKDTQLGKGFAYVQFRDQQCVDEILALGEGNVKFAKRKLRVQRCKTLPGSAPKPKSPTKPSDQAHKVPSSSKSGSAPAHPQSHPKRTTLAPPSAPTPKGDPLLGERIKSLSKEERKAIKSSDADRLARRLAKKKRNALEGLGVSKQGKGSVKGILGKVKRKEKVGGGVKRRARSDNAIVKKNIKK